MVFVENKVTQMRTDRALVTQVVIAIAPKTIDRFKRGGRKICQKYRLKIRLLQIFSVMLVS